MNSNNVIDVTNSLTSNLLSSNDLKADIKLTAERFGLKADESASDILSDLTIGSDEKEVLVAMDQLQENIVVTDNENYVRTLDKNTILYDSGWFDLTKVTTGSNGLSYSSDKNVFEDGATQQGRAKVYVNFNKKEISAEEYQNIIYRYGKEIYPDNLRKWFVSLYQILFGSTNGPRLGSLFYLYKRDKVLKILHDAIN